MSDHHINVTVCDTSLAHELIRAALDDIDNGNNARINAVMNRVIIDHGRPPDGILRLIGALAAQGATIAVAGSTAVNADGDLARSHALIDIVAEWDREHRSIIRPTERPGKG
jgi:hypothetical protein